VSIFVISDHHFFHENILKFEDEDGVRFRGQFSSVEEMNELMIENHNSVVKPQDKVYFLGDVGFGIKKLPSVLSRLNGHLRLVLGNHDYSQKRDFKVYLEWFEKVMESRQMGPILLTHRPVRLGTEGKVKANVHGHIHEKVIDDPRYLNVSVEQVNYTPLPFEEVERIFRLRGVEV
jgi:calcineurin-like phosphoesterase family protein